MVREHALYDFIFLNLLKCLWPRIYCQSWCIFLVYLKRICILLMLGGVFFKCHLDSVGQCCSVLVYLYRIFFGAGSILFLLLRKECWRLQLQFWIWLFSPFISVGFRFMCFETLLLGYTCRICLLGEWPIYCA